MCCCSCTGALSKCVHFIISVPWDVVFCTFVSCLVHERCTQIQFTVVAEAVLQHICECLLTWGSKFHVSGQRLFDHCFIACVLIQYFKSVNAILAYFVLDAVRLGQLLTQSNSSQICSQSAN